MFKARRGINSFSSPSDLWEVEGMYLSNVTPLKKKLFGEQEYEVKVPVKKEISESGFAYVKCDAGHLVYNEKWDDLRIVGYNSDIFPVTITKDGRDYRCKMSVADIHFAEERMDFESPLGQRKHQEGTLFRSDFMILSDSYLLEKLNKNAQAEYVQQAEGVVSDIEGYESSDEEEFDEELGG